MPNARQPRTPPKVPRPTPAPRTAGPAVERLRHDLAAADPGDRRAVLERFRRTTARTTPLVEPVDGSPGEAVVTFLWWDATAERVLLFVNRLTDERRLDDSLMARLPGTDLWHLSYRMPVTWRASYALLPHADTGPPPWRVGDQAALRQALDRGRTDPHNPASCQNRAGRVQSVVALDQAPAQRWLAPRPGVARGRLTERPGPDGRRVWVYEPAGLDPAEPGDLLVVLDGDVWTTTQDLPTTLDNLRHDRAIRPLRALLVDSGDRASRWRDLADGGAAASVAGELLDWARREHPVPDTPSAVTVAGQSLGGLTALNTVVRHPDRVGAAISQSASLWQGDPTTDAAVRRLDGVRAWVEVGTEEWILHPPHRPMVDRLAALGADVAYVEYTGGHDYACWRGGIADGLRHLHPA
ncbi:enterochelin esterase domain-containing protein [Streptomyces sp. NBRC 109706]|uniref:enterochelin esterase domain-containing protein n=1 Tax=Streptomyces sp. NBRC 109706 TaxID=1550035 RepID=UPI0007856D2D|nr:enterochelin esterase domain-containing protein [Streptomyces sp. NBRC 109706]